MNKKLIISLLSTALTTDLVSAVSVNFPAKAPTLGGQSDQAATQHKASLLESPAAPRPAASRPAAIKVQPQTTTQTTTQRTTQRTTQSTITPAQSMGAVQVKPTQAFHQSVGGALHKTGASGSATEGLTETFRVLPPGTILVGHPAPTIVGATVTVAAQPAGTTVAAQPAGTTVAAHPASTTVGASATTATTATTGPSVPSAVNQAEEKNPEFSTGGAPSEQSHVY